MGNEAEDLHFHGGRYGILTEKTSPAWQFTLIDSSFEGQREAAIREHEVGLTLIRDSFRNVPTAIAIDPHYSDQLWVKDSRFQDISEAAVVISNQASPLTEIGVENAVCRNVPVFARFRDSGKMLAAVSATYQVDALNHGLIVPGEGMSGAIETRYEATPLAALPPPLPSALPSLPPSGDWINVRSQGVAGDGQTDDTVAIQAAIDSHPVLYFPSGVYVVRDTLRLKPDSVLMRLHPSMTQLDLPDNAAGYQGLGTPKPLLEAPAGGSDIVSGLGLYTGGFNPRAVALLWKAGANSFVGDVHILSPDNSNHMPDSVKTALYGGDARRPTGAYSTDAGARNIRACG